MSDQAGVGARPEGEAAPTAEVVRPMTEPVAKAARLVQEIFKRRSSKLLSDQKPPQRPNSLYASRIPDCERQGVYEFTNYKDKPAFTWELLALFEAGNTNETAYKAQLRVLGLDLVEDGGPLSEDMRRKYNLGGYMDTRIKWEGSRIPIEMKLTNPNMFASIDGLGADVLKTGEITQNMIERGIASMKRVIWFRKYLRQLTVYLLGTGEEVGMFAFTDGRGNWKFVIVPLDYDEGERILKIAESIKSHVEANTLPDRIPYDHEICGRCPFLSTCIPDIANVPSNRIEGNEALAELFEARDAMKEKWTQVEAIEKKIKAFFENVTAGVYTVGNFIVTRKAGQRKTYEVPDEVKLKYLTMKPTFKNEIERFAQPDPEQIYLEPKRRIVFDDE